MPTQEEIERAEIVQTPYELERAEIEKKYWRFNTILNAAVSVPIVFGFGLMFWSGLRHPNVFSSSVQNYQTPVVVGQYLETNKNLSTLLDLKSKIENVRKHENLFAEPKEYVSTIVSSLEKTITKTRTDSVELAGNPQMSIQIKNEESKNRDVRNIFYGFLAILIGAIGGGHGEIAFKNRYSNYRVALNEKYESHSKKKD